MLDKLFRHRSVWSSALFSFEGGPTDRRQETLVKLFSAKNFRTEKLHAHTLADPFLLVFEDRLYLFLERQREFELGKIIAYSTADLQDWTFHGLVLDEPFHLSYPQVFLRNGTCWMIPETHESGAVWLYRATDFPLGWQKDRKLLEGSFLDTSVLFREEGVYLWATDLEYRLHLFFAPELDGAFEPHPCSPLTTDKRISRSAGTPFQVEGKGLFRLAQDCHKTYGEKVSLLEIKELSPAAYVEKIHTEDFLPKNHPWQKQGVHHFNHVRFKDKNLYVSDGSHEDYLVNNFVHAFFKTLNQ